MLEHAQLHGILDSMVRLTSRYALWLRAAELQYLAGYGIAAGQHADIREYLGRGQSPVFKEGSLRRSPIGPMAEIWENAGSMDVDGLDLYACFWAVVARLPGNIARLTRGPVRHRHMSRQWSL